MMQDAVPWWKAHAALLVRESQAMRALEQAGWLKDLRLVAGNDGLLRWIGTIVFIRSFPFELVYPAEFPAGCPTPYPQDRTKRWSSHQWRDGALCTEYGQDTWHPRFTGADVVRSLHDLLVRENRPAKGFRPQPRVTSRHVDDPWPPPFASFGVILWPKLGPEPDGTGGALKLIPLSGSRNFRFLVNSLSDRSGRVIAPPLPPGFASDGKDIAGRWYRVGHGTPRECRMIPDVEALGRAVVRNNSGGSGTVATELQETAQSMGELPVPVVVVDSRAVPVAGFLYRTSSTRLLPMSVLQCDPERISDRRVTRLPPVPAPIVAVVGLGSLGGKIAVSLARIGVQEFVLVDPDVLLWENLSRHEGTVRDIGALKTDVIANRIRASNPSANVEELDAAVGTVLSPKSYLDLRLALGKCTVIVDATANPGAARVIAALCQPLGIGSVHVEVFARGLGAQVLRVLPNETGCYYCQQAAVAAFLSDKASAPNRDAESYDGAPEDASPSATADDDACAIVAGVATRMVKDVLLRGSGVPGSVPGHIYLVGLERGWIFTEPFAVIRVDSAGPRSDCVGCSGDEALCPALRASEEDIAGLAKAVEESIEFQDGETITAGKS